MPLWADLYVRNNKIDFVFMSLWIPPDSSLQEMLISIFEDFVVSEWDDRSHW